MERIIITPEILVEMFSHQPLDVMLWSIAPFAEPSDEKAFAAFKQRRDYLIEEPDGPAKEIVLDVIGHLESAFMKMTPFERENCRKRLVDKMAEWMLKKS